MEKKVTLKDGTEAVIRALTRADIDNSISFFQSLSAEEKSYLRVDVSNGRIVEQRLENVGLRNVKRIGAFIDDEMTADGALELNTHGWESHIAELRLMVADRYHGKGLGALMADELYMMANSEKIEEIIVKIMKANHAAINVFKKLGFHETTTIPNYVKDIKGAKQDLVIMRCNLEDVWQKLEDALQEQTHANMN